MEREALVVGINTYPRIGDLDKPEADAKAIADILDTYGGFKVTRLPEAFRYSGIAKGGIATISHS